MDLRKLLHMNTSEMVDWIIDNHDDYILVKKSDKRAAMNQSHAEIFVRHIEAHLPKDQQVCCKICDKSYGTIIKEALNL